MQRQISIHPEAEKVMSVRGESQGGVLRRSLAMSRVTLHPNPTANSVGVCRALTILERYPSNATLLNTIVSKLKETYSTHTISRDWECWGV